MFKAVLTTAALAGALLTSQARAQTIAPAPPEAMDTATVKHGDPFEGANRELYGINKALDRAVIRPGSVFYHHATPTPVRHGLHNFVYNLGEPVSFFNYVLQVRPTRAVNAMGRFAINSTVGLLGFVDVASSAGIPAAPTGFGQTLGRYGTPEGPYIFIPIAGPSSVRDVVGRVVDVVTDPFNFVDYRGREVFLTGRTVVEGLDSRVAADQVLKDVDRTATDPYATLRSAYLQNSASKINNGVVDVKALPDFGPDPSAPEPVKPAPTSPSQP